jgi:NlpC/P60 family
MTHWSDKYIGRPYISQDYDCSALAQDIAIQEFGLQVQLPADHGCNSLGHQRQFLRYKGRVADRIMISEVQDGDLVLMITNDRMNHVGVYYVDAEGIAWVVHNASQVGSVVRTKLRCLADCGYGIEGFYRTAVES